MQGNNGLGNLKKIMDPIGLKIGGIKISDPIGIFDAISPDPVSTPDPTPVAPKTEPAEVAELRRRQAALEKSRARGSAVSGGLLDGSGGTQTLG